MSTQETPVALLGRTIPVVASAEELSRLQQAAQLIEEKVRGYKAQYALTDEGYLLRMACLELAAARLADTEAATLRLAAIEQQATDLETALATDLAAFGLGR